MRFTVLALLCALMLTSINTLLAQGEAAVPFLLISSSPEANGWGNNATAVPSNNAINMIANPAQLGVFSLAGYFTGTSYAHKTQWLPSFRLDDLTYNVWAVGAGYDFGGLLDLPMPLALGVWYSRVDMNLGTFTRTGSGGPDPIGTFTAYERAEAVTVALGVDYFVRLGFGMSFGKALSSIGPIIGSGLGSAEVRPSTTDFGLLLDIPIIGIIERMNGEPIVSESSLQPIINISSGYAIHTTGFFKLVQALSRKDSPGSVFDFIMNHLDIAYDYASYGAEANHPLDDTIFQSLTLIVR